MALFFSNERNELVPIAIQLFQKSADDNPVSIDNYHCFLAYQTFPVEGKDLKQLHTSLQNLVQLTCQVIRELVKVWCEFSLDPERNKTLYMVIACE